MLTTGGPHPEAEVPKLVVPDCVGVDGDTELHLLGIRKSYLAVNANAPLATDRPFVEYVLIWNWRSGFLASVSILP